MLIFRLDRLRLSDGTLKESQEGDISRKIILFSFITVNESRSDIVDSWLKNFDNKLQNRALRNLLRNSLKACLVICLPEVFNNKIVPVGHGGEILIQTKTVPRYFNWTLVAGCPNNNYVSNVIAIKDLVKDKSFYSFSQGLPRLLTKNRSKEASRFEAQVEVDRFVALAYITKLVRAGGCQVGAISTKLSHEKDFPNNILESHDVQDMLKQLFVDFSLFSHGP